MPTQSKVNLLVNTLKTVFAKKSHTQNYSTITVDNDVKTELSLTENHSAGEVSLSCDVHILDDTNLYKLPIPEASVKFYGNDTLLATISANSDGTATFYTSITETTTFKCVFDATGDYPAGESNNVTIGMSSKKDTYFETTNLYGSKIFVIKSNNVGINGLTATFTTTSTGSTVTYTSQTHPDFGQIIGCFPSTNADYQTAIFEGNDEYNPCSYP